MAMQSESFDCVIVGAGISGLLAATELERAGMRTCILEKGRGPGGRMATRRRDGAVFDHGAQFFTARDPRFGARVEEWLGHGIVKPWYEFPGSDTHYRGHPGMTAVPKHLAADLDVRYDTTVGDIGYSGGVWTLGAASQLFVAPSLLLTAPVPQSLALLDSGGVLLPPTVRLELETIRFHRCIAALALLDRPSALEQHGGSIKLAEEPVQWIADNQRKGISPNATAVTIHSTPAFADKHWDAEDSRRLPPLLEAAAPHLEAQVIACHGHRWGFSQPMRAFSTEAFVDQDRRFAIAGDGLAGGRVEGAAISGLAAATELIRTLPSNG